MLPVRGEGDRRLPSLTRGRIRSNHLQPRGETPRPLERRRRGRPLFDTIFDDAFEDDEVTGLEFEKRRLKRLVGGRGRAVPSLRCCFVDVLRRRTSRTVCHRLL